MIFTKAAQDAEQFLEKLADFTGQDLSTTSTQTENVAVNAEELVSGLKVKENTMEELETQSTATAPIQETADEANTNLEANAATDKKPEGDAPKADEAPKAPEAPKDDQPADKKPGEEGKGQGKDMKAVKDALKDIEANCQEPVCIENVKKIREALGIKDEAPAAPVADPLGAPAPAMPAPAPLGAPAAADAPLAAEECGTACAASPVANLVATFKKEASVANSTWMIKNASDNSDFGSFTVAAAFGANIDSDEVRSQYATSEEFGKAVVAALQERDVKTAEAFQNAILTVSAHYNPGYPSQVKSNKPSSHPKAQGGLEGTDDNDKKDMPYVTGGAKEATAAVEAPIAKEAKAEDKKCEKCGKEPCECKKEEKKAAADAALTKEAAMGEGAGVEAKPGEDGKVLFDGKILPGADKRTVVEHSNMEESGHPKASNPGPVEKDTAFKMASLEEKLAKQASEIEALKAKNNELTVAAALKEKTAKVKECVALMCNKGFIKADEDVRVAALKDGLSLEASNGKAMASAIEKQAKNLYAMSTPQLDAYMSSLKGIQAPMTTSASVQGPLTIKASAQAATEEDRLAKILGWD